MVIGVRGKRGTIALRSPFWTEKQLEALEFFFGEDSERILLCPSDSDHDDGTGGLTDIQYAVRHIRQIAYAEGDFFGILRVSPEGRITRNTRTPATTPC